LARVQQCRARRLLWLGFPTEATKAVDRVLDSDRLPDLNDTEKGALWGFMSRCLAGVGDTDHARRAIDRADRHMAAHDPGHGQEHPWWGHYDMGHHWGDTGAALRVLAQQAQGRETLGGQSAARLKAAAEDHGKAAVLRSQAMAAVGLAYTDMTLGDVRFAAVEGDAVLDLVTGQHVRSGRVFAEVGRLRDEAAKYRARVPECADLVDHCNTVLAA